MQRVGSPLAKQSLWDEVSLFQYSVLATSVANITVDAPDANTTSYRSRLATSVANFTVAAPESNATSHRLRQGWGVDGNPIVVPIAAVAIGVIGLLALLVASKVRWGKQRADTSVFNDSEAMKIFNDIDTDHNGTLTLEAVRLYMKKMGCAVPDNQLMALMELADADNSGDLDTEEFRILLTTIRDENPKDLARCLTAEMIGMLIFQFLGGLPDTGAVGNWLIVVGLIYCFASISGAHFNPTLTLAVWLSGQINISKAMWYVFVNIIAAVEGVLLLKWMGIKQIDSDSGLPIVPCTTPGAIIPTWELFILEFACTFTFVIVFLGVALDTKSAWGNIAPVVIGITGYGVCTACGKISGVSMNPARFLAPCIGYGCFPGPGETAAYLCSAFAGSMAATLIYLHAFMNRPKPELAGGMANFQFMVRDATPVKQKLASHRRMSIHSEHTH